MQKFRKFLSFILVCSLICGTLSISAEATAVDNGIADDNAELQTDNMIVCEEGVRFLQVDGMPYSFRCDSNIIPIDFYLCGFEPDENYMLQIEGSIAITHTFDSQKTYPATDNRITFEIAVEEAATIQTFTSMYTVDYDYITITVTTDSEPAKVIALELHIINSQYGLFASSTNQTAVFKKAVGTLYREGLINMKEYDAAIASTCCLPDNPGTQPMTMSTMDTTSTSALTGTTVTVQYSISVPSAGQLTVSGTVHWTDTDGDSIAARGVKVEIMDEDTLFNDVIDTVFTSTTGNFSSTFSNQSTESGCDIFLKVYPESESIDVFCQGETNVLNTSVKTGIHNDVNSPLGPMTAFFSASDITNAFQVHQAVYAAETYARQQLGSVVNVIVDYPVSNRTSCGYMQGSSTIMIVEGSFSSWDVIMHEYGHHVGFHNQIDGSYQLGHSSSDDLIMKANSKEIGCRSAWSEGWATYFGCSAQLMGYAKNLGVPGVGNARYENYRTDPDMIVYLETGQGIGEGNEKAVFCALWDIADSSGSTGSVYESFDNVALGFNTVFNLIMTFRPITFSYFAWRLYAYLGGSSANHRNLGGILSRQRMAASNLTYDESSIELSFKVAYGSEKNPITYYLEIYDTSYSYLLYSQLIGTWSNSSSTVYCIPPAHILSDLSDNYTGSFYWRIKAVPVNKLDDDVEYYYYSEFHLASMSEWR